MALSNLLSRWSKATICTGMFVALVGCHKDEPTPQKNTDAPKQQRLETKSDAKTLNFYLQREPISMDPRKSGSRISGVVLRELFEGLMRLDSQGEPSFAVAKDIDVSEDKCTYRFHLRPCSWSNGMPVTAHDFEYAWKSNISPDTTSACSYAFYCIKNARAARMNEIGLDEVGIKAEDDHTLVVTLEHPAPYFVELTSNPVYSPVCKAVVEKNNSWSSEAGPGYVSNGPFVLDQWKHQSEIVLRKNLSYWDAPSVAAQKISFPLIENPQTALNMFERGALDWVGDPFGDIPLEAIPRLKEQKLLQSHRIGHANWYQLNTKHPLLSSVKIRKALAMAMNRQELVDHLLQGGEKPAYSILPESLTLLKEQTFKDNDIQLAALLFEEGLQEMNLTRDSLPVLNISHSSEPRDKMIAEATQQQWQKVLGVKAALCPADGTSHLGKLTTGDFEIALMTWYTFFNDPIYNLAFMKFKTGSYNATNWEHSHYIALLDQSDAEADTAHRNDLLCQAEEFLMNEMPVIPICYNTSIFIKNPKVNGESLSPIGMFEWKKIDLDNGGLVLVNNKN